MKEKLYIVIPAYNEEANIENCIKDWYPIAEEVSGESKLVIIDDGSKDSTYDILIQLAKQFTRLVPITKCNGGHGSAVLFGYHYAVKEKADYIFQTDSDGQTNPKEFKQFWKNRENYDAIIGNRVIRGDGRIRKIIEHIVCLLIRIFFGVKVLDANAPFRLMKTSVVEKYINKLPDEFNIPNIMFTTYFAYNNENIKYVPISFKSRQGGKNSLNLKKIFKIGWKAIGDFRKLKKEMD